VIVSDAVNNREPVRLALSTGASVHNADGSSNTLSDPASSS